MSDHFFPHEILVEILHRLPPKTLLRCTTVCKSWRSLITHPSFISLHHRHSPSFLLLQLCNQRTLPNLLQYSLCCDDPFLTHSSSLILPSSDLEFSVVAIYNGLVCITAGEACLTLIICNPCVRRFVSLPRPCDYPCFYDACVGFGFDSRNSDYKVVRIACMVDDERFGLSSPHIEVYSLATGFWRNLDGVAPVCTLCFVGRDAPHGFVDGVVHWGAKRRVGDDDDDGWWYYFVLSFDFEDEVFREVVLPECLARGFSDAVTVVGGGGSNGKTLTVYCVRDDSPCSCEIWVMKECGVVESWNKVFAFNLRGFCLEAPSLGITVMGVTAPPAALCVRNSGEVLLLMDEAGKGRLYSVDVERKRLTELQIGGEGYTWYLYSGYYSESLVLLNKTSGLVSY